MMPKGGYQVASLLSQFAPPLPLGVGRSPDLPFDLKYLNPNKDGKDKVFPPFETHKMRNLVLDDQTNRSTMGLPKNQVP